jgi:TPR repeat protein
MRIEEDKGQTAKPIIVAYPSQSRAGTYNLGVLYKWGICVERDMAKAVELFEKEHAAGHVKAAYNLGLMYQRGEGVEQNSAKAAEFYELAHEKGYYKATYNLAKMYERGLGVEWDSVKAAKLFQQVAEFADDAEGRFASRASLRTHLKKPTK